MNAVKTASSPSPDDRPVRPPSARVRPTEPPLEPTPTVGPADRRAWESRRPPEFDPRRAATMTCSVRPAPEREPSFDDEPRSRHLHLIPAVATPQLPFPQTSPAPSPTLFPAPSPALEPARRLTVVPDLPEPTLVATDPTPPRSPAPSPSSSPVRSAPPSPGTQHRPDPSRFSRQFAQGVVEVLSGRRPMVQLTRHVSPAVQRGLARAGGSQPLKSPNAPTLHSLHLSEPAAGVCEMSAIVVVGARYRALAARLEWKIDHWRCTALQIG